MSSEEHEVSDVEVADDDSENGAVESCQGSEGDVPSYFSQDEASEAPSSPALAPQKRERVESAVSAAEEAPPKKAKKAKIPLPAVGEKIEAYWPDDECWMKGKLIEVHGDGSCRIRWASDRSETDLPAKYVRKRGANAEEKSAQPEANGDSKTPTEAKANSNTPKKTNNEKPEKSSEVNHAKPFTVVIHLTPQEKMIRKAAACGNVAKFEIQRSNDGKPNGLAKVTYADQKGKEAALKLDKTEVGSCLVNVTSGVKDVIVRGLPNSVNVEALKTHFRNCGQIKRFVISKDSGSTKFAVLTYKQQKSADEALKFDGTMFSGCRLRVSQEGGADRNKKGKKKGKRGAAQEKQDEAKRKAEDSARQEKKEAKKAAWLAREARRNTPEELAAKERRRIAHEALVAEQRAAKAARKAVKRAEREALLAAKEKPEEGKKA